jgi:hypothetical protein
VAAEFISLADRLIDAASGERGSRHERSHDRSANCDTREAAGPPVSTVPHESAPVSHLPDANPPAATEPADDAASHEVNPPHAVANALRDARLFRARLADAFAFSSRRLLRDLASDVLARELRLAPCDLGALVRRAAENVPVVRVRVAPCDLGFAAAVPVIADTSLSAGDAVVELDGGALDARLGVRLAAVLEAFT